MSELMQAARRFWFNNEPGPFMVGNRPVSRAEIYRYGGPSLDFDACEVCQRSEWLSRLDQANRFEQHKCKMGKACHERCQRQGDDAWGNYHQDHWFAATGCEAELDAPRGALLLQDGASQYKWFWDHNCNAGMFTFRQKLAYATQANTAVRLTERNWDNYDWAWMVNKGEIPLVDRPPVPIALYCHDAWRGNKQEVIDHYKPEIIFTPFPALWETFNIPDGSELMFTPAMPADFFARPNLDPAKKKWDLLVIGATGSHFYEPRVKLNEKLEALPSKYTVEHSHAAGSKRARWYGPVDDGDHCYLGKWSEKLGAARFVIFGGCAGRAKEMLLIKYYECLSSGAVPIVPEVRDLELIGVEPMQHYIPLSAVWDNVGMLGWMIDHYEQFHYIAENAVAWYQANVHELVFGTFERMVRRLTGERYPERVL